jgi:sugar O-acyltransferase (sialic acid O-acetyltransferase NeuD family)
MARQPLPGARHALQTETNAERIVIVGAGEQGAIAYQYFTDDSPHEVVAFAVESRFIDADRFYGLPVVPLEDLASAYAPADYRAFVAVSSTQLNRVRRRLLDQVTAQGFETVSYASSHAFVWPNVAIGRNTFVFENNVLQHEVSLGDNVILWSGNHVGHQTAIGDDCFIASHVVISGFCTVGRGSYLGVNCCVADNISIAEDCVIGAGAVVVRDTEPRKVYVGNPAKPIPERDSFDAFAVDRD